MSEAPSMVIEPAISSEDIGHVRVFFRAYAEYLAGSLDGVVGVAFPDLDHEIATLPGFYSLLLLAKIDAEPAGLATLKPLLRPGEHACELKRLWVDPGFRGLGLGRRLIEAAIDRAQAAGYQAVYLDSIPAAMPDAIRLYQHLGFLLVARYNGNYLPGVSFFRLALTPASVFVPFP